MHSILILLLSIIIYLMTLRILKSLYLRSVKILESIFSEIKEFEIIENPKYKHAKVIDFCEPHF